MIDLAQPRSNLKSRAPNPWNGLGSLAKKWTATALDELDAGRSHAACPKTFNDPIWGVVELLPWETLLLDSPLLQRRGVRQFGMAHLVYPGAGLDRLEHTRTRSSHRSSMLRGDCPFRIDARRVAPR